MLSSTNVTFIHLFIPRDIFRSLFTANERMKSEYCNLQTDYKTLKVSSIFTCYSVLWIRIVGGPPEQDSDFLNLRITKI